MNGRWQCKAWDGKKMYHDVYVSLEDNKIHVYDMSSGYFECFGDRYIDNAIPLQCTGLKDRNDKLIFEGDVLQFLEYDDCEYGSSRMHYVHFVWTNEEGQAMYQTHDKDGFTGSTEEWMCGDELEVIGNRYQNPELLEKGSE